MMEQVKLNIGVQQHPKLFRDFLDVLLIARQQNLDIIVPDRLPLLDALLEMKANPQDSLAMINKAYTHKFQNLQLYKGEFTNLASMMKLRNMRVYSSGRLAQVDHESTICYTTSNLRNSTFESSAKYLAVSVFDELLHYMGTKVFARESMLELISLW